MEEKLIAYFNRIMPLNDDEVHGIISTLTIQQFKKGTILLHDGEVSNAAYFVLEGCVHQYYLVDGEEKTCNFFTEEQWVISMNSFGNQQASNHYMACCTDCLLVVGNREKEETLYSKFPRLETVSRKVMEKVFAEQQDLMSTYYTDNPEQRYLKLIKSRPELIQLVPQYLIASFIGVKPESLSRIRKRLAHKD